MRGSLRVMILLAISYFLSACDQQDNSDLNNNHFISVAAQTWPLVNTAVDAAEELSLQQHLGQWVFINVWATWCPPCYAEIPDLNRFAMRYAPQAVMLGVNYDNKIAEELLDDIHTMGIGFPVFAANPLPSLGISHVPVLPSTIVVNPAGQIVGVLEGEQTFADLLKVMGQG